MSDLFNTLFPFSTDIYGDGGRSDCCVEHDSILGEKLSVSENQYCQVLYDKDYLAHPLSHWLSSILLIVLLLFFLFLLLKGFSWRLLLCPSPQHLQPPQPLQSPGFKTFINIIQKVSMRMFSPSKCLALQFFKSKMIKTCYLLCSFECCIAILFRYHLLKTMFKFNN